LLVFVVPGGGVSHGSWGKKKRHHPWNFKVKDQIQQLLFWKVWGFKNRSFIKAPSGIKLALVSHPRLEESATFCRIDLALALAVLWIATDHTNLTVAANNTTHITEFFYG
jgi:hypothetical protein